MQLLCDKSVFYLSRQYDRMDSDNIGCCYFSDMGRTDNIKVGTDRQAIVQVLLVLLTCTLPLSDRTILVGNIMNNE